MSAAELLKISPYQVLGAMLQTLTEIRDELYKLRTAVPPKRPDDRPYRYAISSGAGENPKTIPTAFHVTGLIINSDTSGRGVLQVGSDVGTNVFSTLAYAALYLDFKMDNRLIIEGGTAVTWVQPGSTIWDVTLIGHAR